MICPFCGHLMDEIEENERKIYFCPSCGYYYEVLDNAGKKSSKKKVSEDA